MNRKSLILASVLLAGCGSPTTPQALESPTTVPVVAAPPAAAPANPGPGAPIPPPVASTPIFELSQDGKIYVFAFVDHMLAFQHSGKAQPVVIEKPDFTAKHTTLVIEASDEAMAAEILAAYVKQHPEDKK